MKLRKKALFPAIAMVLASVIALSGVTYAWFTTSNEATVGTLDVNVAAANGIQVSLDGVAWMSTLTADDIIDAITNQATGNYKNAVNQYPTGEIAPVSSAGDVKDGKLQMYFGAYNDAGLLTSTREEESARTSGGNFIAFDLFVKSSMDQNMSMIIGDAASYVASSAKFGAKDVKTQAAVRVAFLPMGCDATNPDSASAAQALTGDGTVYIWEPNAGMRAAGVTATSDDYKGFCAEFPDGVKESELGADQVKSVTTLKNSSDFTDLFPLKNGINKIRIYIWLEGQDVDCVNAISTGDFAVNLFFTVPEIED